MRRIDIRLGTLICLAAIVLLDLAAFAKINFEANSRHRFDQLSAGALVVSVPCEGWKPGYNYFHSSKVSKDDPRRQKLRSCVKYVEKDGVCAVRKGTELRNLVGDDELVRVTSGGYRQRVSLPDAAGGSYRLAFDYRLEDDPLFESASVMVTPRRSDAKEGAFSSAPGDRDVALRSYDLAKRLDGWKRFARDLRIAPGPDELELVMRLNGLGTLAFRNVTLCRLSAVDAITLACSPADWLDGVFCVSCGQGGIVNYLWRKNTSEDYVWKDFSFSFELPAGFALVDVNCADIRTAKTTVLKNGSTEYRLSPLGCGVKLRDDYVQHDRLGFLVRADRPDAHGDMALTVSYRGKAVSNRAVNRLETIAPVRAKVPQAFQTGFYIGGLYSRFPTEEGRRLWAELFTAAGATWVVTTGDGDSPVYDLWRALGVRTITPQSALCSNGFEIGNPKTRPPCDCYVPKTPVKRPYFSRCACPLSVSGESDYFRTNTLPALAQLLKGADGLWSNWEPYSFARQGCMCEKCRVAFALYVGVSDEEMAKDWPQELDYGRKWYDKVTRFRSIEHGKVVKTLAKHIPEMSGGKSSVGFIPGIALREMSSQWRPKNLAAEVQAIDYAGSLRWINPWGPYPWWDANQPYLDRVPVEQYFDETLDVRRQVDADYGAKAPKLLGFPHAYQLDALLSRPEDLALALASYFFNGWNAAVFYAFPKGYDARYWRAFAEGTTLIADWEPFVRDGRRCDAEVTCAPAAPLLRSAAYVWRGRTIVAVFNFDERAPVSVSLKSRKGEAAAGTVPPLACRVFELQNK